MHSETSYKRQFRKDCGVWSEVYETRSGGGVGYADLQLLVGAVLVPVELKRGLVLADRLVSTRIRPAQIGWHHDLLVAGGKSFVVVCMGPVSSMDAWAIPSVHRDCTSRWKKGWKVYQCTQWMRGGKLTMPLGELTSG